MSVEKILVVEDDSSILAGLVLNLETEGYEVLTAKDGDHAIQQFRDARPDLVLLDIMLPKSNGFEVLSEIRRSDPHTAVLLLTARDRPDDKILGLDLGADDYVTKPFDVAELIARINAALRRKRLTTKTTEKISFGRVVIETDGRRVLCADEELEMTRREYDLLLYLVTSSDRVLSRGQILDRVWGNDYDGTERTVDNFVARLRTKIELNPEKPDHIETVRGIGYRFVR